MKKTIIEVICPFCTGLSFQVHSSDDGPVAIMHRQPACKEFMDNEPDQFLVLVNNKLFGEEWMTARRESEKATKH